MITLTPDKTDYISGDIINLTVTYDVVFAGKPAVLYEQGVYSQEVKRVTTGTTGVSTFQFRPVRQGNYTFYVIIENCFFFIACGTSNMITVNVTGGTLPCDPLDPLCQIKPITDPLVGFLKWLPYIIILVIVIMIFKEYKSLSR